MSLGNGILPYYLLISITRAYSNHPQCIRTRSCVSNRLLPDKALCLGLESVSEDDLAILSQRMTLKHAKEFLCAKAWGPSHSRSFIPHRRLLDHAVLAHNALLLKYLIEQIDIKPTRHTLNLAMNRKKNNLYIIRYLIEHHAIELNQSTLIQAVRSGNIKKVAYCYGHLPLQSEINNQLAELQQPIKKLNNAQKAFKSFLYALWGSAVHSGNVETVQFITHTFLKKLDPTHQIGILWHRVLFPTIELFNIACKEYTECLPGAKVTQNLTE